MNTKFIPYWKHLSRSSHFILDPDARKFIRVYYSDIFNKIFISFLYALDLNPFYNKIYKSEFSFEDLESAKARVEEFYFTYKDLMAFI